MTITRPLRLMTLHFSQIGLTDGLTFISCSLPFFSERHPGAVYIRFLLRRLRSFETVGYAATRQIVRSQFQRDLIARQYTNEVHADFA